MVANVSKFTKLSLTSWLFSPGATITLNLSIFSNPFIVTCGHSGLCSAEVLGHFNARSCQADALPQHAKWRQYYMVMKHQCSRTTIIHTETLITSNHFILMTEINLHSQRANLQQRIYEKCFIWEALTMIWACEQATSHPICGFICLLQINRGTADNFILKYQCLKY